MNSLFFLDTFEFFLECSCDFENTDFPQKLWETTTEKLLFQSQKYISKVRNVLFSLENFKILKKN